MNSNRWLLENVAINLNHCLLLCVENIPQHNSHWNILRLRCSSWHIICCSLAFRNVLSSRYVPFDRFRPNFDDGLYLRVSSHQFGRQFKIHMFQLGLLSEPPDSCTYIEDGWLAVFFVFASLCDARLYANGLNWWGGRKSKCMFVKLKSKRFDLFRRAQ